MQPKLLSVLLFSFSLNTIFGHVLIGYYCSLARVLSIAKFSVPLIQLT